MQGSPGSKVGLSRPTHLRHQRDKQCERLEAGGRGRCEQTPHIIVRQKLALCHTPVTALSCCSKPPALTAQFNDSTSDHSHLLLPCPWRPLPRLSPSSYPTTRRPSSSTLPHLTTPTTYLIFHLYFTTPPRQAFSGLGFPSSETPASGPLQNPSIPLLRVILPGGL
jgi:hypothetical protein